MWISPEIWPKASPLNNLVLIGLMGSGKTSVGQEIARHLGYTFLDTDQTIEKEEKRSITEIFKTEGEPYFRNCERQLCQTLKTLNKTVIATGGGMIVDPKNREDLKKTGKIIWLKTNLEATLSRLNQDHSRPLLEQDRAQKLELLISQRFPLYGQLAEIIVETDQAPIYQIAQEIISRL